MPNGIIESTKTMIDGNIRASILVLLTFKAIFSLLLLTPRWCFQVTLEFRSYEPLRSDVRVCVAQIIQLIMVAHDFYAIINDISVLPCQRESLSDEVI